jgi:hypothetical protein
MILSHPNTFLRRTPPPDNSDDSTIKGVAEDTTISNSHVMPPTPSQYVRAAVFY